MSRCTLLLLLALGAPSWTALAAGVCRASPVQDLASEVSALDSGDARRARASWLALAAAGDAGAAAALEGFSEASALARRLRARLVAEHADLARIDAVLAHFADPDPEVRAEWIRFLARADHGTRELERRVDALVGRVHDDERAPLRAAAIEALGRFDEPAGVAALNALARTAPAPERALAAASFPATPRSAQAVRELVSAAFVPLAPSARTPEDVLAAVLPLFGRQLASEVGAGLPARAGAALVLALRHPAPDVRRAAGDAFEALLLRLRELGEGRTALRVLADLERFGLDPRVLHYHRARLALFPAGDAEAAVESARRLRAPGAGGPDSGALGALGNEREELWAFRSYYLEGVALLALGRAAEGRAFLEDAATLLDGLLSERRDLADERASERHVDTLHQRALLEVALVVADLQEGRAPAAPLVLERARRAHELGLEAQAAYAALRGEAVSGWDSVLDTELSPYRLLFTGVALPGLDRARSVELQARLGRVLATVAPREVPGLEPLAREPAELVDPLRDPSRLAHLQAAQQGRLEGLLREIGRVQERAARARGGVLPEEDLALLEALDLRRRIVQRDLLAGEREGWRALLDLRVPSALALWLARDLRNEGNGAASREYAERMQKDLERAGIANEWYWLGQERLAQADMAIGNAWTDDDDPRRAEEALLRAVQRLEDIERRLLERGSPERALASFRNQRASALVSLAVNANVKLGQPERALEFYQQAYALRQDDFMRVLLACYRARSGREVEARALLREIRAGPGTWYNMACTHALLGDVEDALDFLEKELEGDHHSEASRRRQREWAKGDPDLAKLRGDPRFERLVGGR